jgi:hypothetical protein
MLKDEHYKTISKNNAALNRLLKEDQLKNIN